MLDVTAKQWIFQRIRLVIVDRQPIVLQGLKSVLGAQQEFDVVASSSDGTSCLEAIRNLTPDVALVADTLPDLTVSEILAIVKAENLPTRLVFFTESDTDHELAAAIAAGACSAISKYDSPETMLRSLRLMAKRGVSLERSDLSPAGKDADVGKIEKLLGQLTQRERQIVRLVSEGMSNKEIARQINVSQGTVKVHLHNIFQKLEITNRTVLATIALLQRTSVFGTLALAFLAFAIEDELKASEAVKASGANDRLSNDGSIGHASQHTEYEPWKKAILRHRIAWESSETPPPTLRDFLAKMGQVTTAATAMEALRAAEQVGGPKPWNDHGPVGSSTPSLPALLPRGASDAQLGDLPPDHQLPPPPSNPMSFQGGYGTFAALTGALIYALNDPHLAAQAHEAGKGSIDGFLGPAGENATTKLAAITDAGSHHVDDPAPAFPESHQPSAGVTTGHESAAGEPRGQTGDGAVGDNLQPVGSTDLGHDAGAEAYGRDQMIEGHVGENAVQPPPSDSSSTSSASAFDFASGSSRISLEAFGALAWLHMTAASKSIPPHTLAWIYDAASNETIVYVNSTDHSLDIGDRGLVEVHLQGIVSVAESDFVAQPEAASIAVTLEQLEQALPSAIATEETALSTDNVQGTAGSSDGAFGTSGAWSILADDGSRFLFRQIGDGSGNSARSVSFTGDPADATEESDGPPAASAPPSSVVHAHRVTVAANENPASKSEPTNANTSVSSTAQSEIVQTSVVTATGATEADSAPGSSGEHRAAASEEHDNEHGNSGHSNSANATDSVEQDVATSDSASHGNSQQAHEKEHGNSDHSASASVADAAVSTADAATADNASHGNSQQAHDKEHGNSDHSASASVADAAVSAEPDAATADSASHGNSQQAHEKEHGNSDHSASVNATDAADSAEPDAATADSASHGNSQNASAQGSAQAAEAHDKEHGNSDHSGSANATDAADSVEPGVVTADSASHGNSQNASEQGSAQAAEAHDKEQGNSDHPASANASKAADGVGQDVATTDGAGPGNSQHASEPGPAKAAATASAEADPAPGNSGGNGNGHHDPAADIADASAAVTTTDPTEHGNSGHDAESASASSPDAIQSVDPDVATADSAGPGNSQHASEPGPAKAATASAEADPTPGNSGGNGNGHHDPAADVAGASAAVTTTDPTEHGNSGHDAEVASASTPDATQSVDPDVATADSAGPGNSQHASEPGPAKAAATASAEADPTPGNSGGNGNGHHDPAADIADASAAVTTTDPTEHGNSGHDAQSAPASPPDTAEIVVPSDATGAVDAAQPAQAASAASGADPELVFRFDNLATAPAAAVVEPQQLDNLLDSHVPPGQQKDLDMIVQATAIAPDEHAASHGNGGSHHAVVPASHDYLL
ncbi:LuxR C-terminal-related transcriptional regulator [Bradyrhizobium sp. CCBAU 53338]|uniref:LuxR C-terminal-related transcriptional regulator n=1 Tax=Bradyrhizobium sp. CCBAU 53338 TaxID=1325111 RepID=UPI00188D1274|nr:LuxR C-terminal-related transcriptional regulator [Bradyrhizobium sp. CCBAU 53338]